MNRAFLAACALACAALLPAKAGLFDDDEARRRIQSLRDELAQQGRDNEARIVKLEEQIRNIGVVELVRQLDELNAEIARLRGQIEVLNNDNQQLQKRQRDFYLDLDSRMKRLEGAAQGAGAAAAPGAAVAPGAAATPGTAAGAGAAGDSRPPEAGPLTPRSSASREDQAREMRAYDNASNLFRRNDFPAAIDAFRGFTKEFPASALVPNAEYWIGISYANLRDYRNALAAQEGLLARHPQSPKAADAMLAIAAIQVEQGDSGSARNTLEEIIARYPGSEAAGKARSRLASLRR